MVARSVNEVVLLAASHREVGESVDEYATRHSRFKTFRFDAQPSPREWL